MPDKGHVITVKVNDATRDRIVAAHETLKQVYPQFALGRSDAIREVIKRGLASIEAEHSRNREAS